MEMWIVRVLKNTPDLHSESAAVAQLISQLRSMISSPQFCSAVQTEEVDDIHKFVCY